MTDGSGVKHRKMGAQETHPPWERDAVPGSGSGRQHFSENWKRPSNFLDIDSEQPGKLFPFPQCLDVDKGVAWRAERNHLIPGRQPPRCLYQPTSDV